MAFYVSKEVITQLVKNYFEHSEKENINTGDVQPLSPSTDTYSIWFSKTEIDAIFNANNPGGNIPDDKLGIRVYIGQHWDTQVEKLVIETLQEQGVVIDEAVYRGQQCVILVPTRQDANGNNVDLLQDGLEVVNTTAQAGLGIEYGGPCPPPVPCPGTLIVV